MKWCKTSGICHWRHLQWSMKSFGQEDRLNLMQSTHAKVPPINNEPLVHDCVSQVSKLIAFNTQSTSKVTSWQTHDCDSDNTIYGSSTVQSFYKAIKAAVCGLLQNKYLLSWFWSAKSYNQILHHMISQWVMHKVEMISQWVMHKTEMISQWVMHKVVAPCPPPPPPPPEVLRNCIGFHHI